MSPLAPILLVEDREEDVYLLQRAFARAAITRPVFAVSDGQQAIAYLAGEGKFADRAAYPLPCLVLLDLKLPLKMGLEVLEWIRHKPAVRSLIVIILTSSLHHADVQRAYALGVNAFLVKPANSHTMLEMCRALHQFWFVFNQPPPAPGQGVG